MIVTFLQYAVGGRYETLLLIGIVSVHSTSIMVPNGVPPQQPLGGVYIMALLTKCVFSSNYTPYEYY